MSNPIEIEIVNPNVPTHNLQTKIVTPSKDIQVVTADEGYFGLREVIVSPPAVDGDSLLEAINTVNTNINSVNSNIDEAETNINSNIDSITVMLSDGDATSEDIETGKIAYVKGQKIVGNGGSMLKKLLDFTKTSKSMFSSQKTITDLTGYIRFEDTSNVETMEGMFSYSDKLIKIPQLDTHNVKKMNYMFRDCKSLTTIPQLDTSNVTDMGSMFQGCTSLTTIPQLDTRNVTDMGYMFRNCISLVTIQQLDMLNVTYNYSMFDSCDKTKNLTLKNIKINLQVGSGTSYGSKITLESLLGLCKECINVNESRTLTVGTYGLSKLSNIYVKLTGEAEEDETLPKLPMVQCESTDDGAMTIRKYMLLKNWSLS